MSAYIEHQHSQMVIAMAKPGIEISRDMTPAQATGFCLYCEEPLEAPRRWCNKECASGWEQEHH